MAKKLSNRLLQRVRKAGLPEPQPQLSKAQFAKLQKQWYAKLASEDFKDIEWVNHSTGTGHDSGFLRGSMGGGKAYHPGRDLYFQLASNYLVHCKKLRQRPYDRLLWKLHSEGLTYDEVHEQMSKRYSSMCSKFTMYYQIQNIAKLCYKWNLRHPEGLLRKRAEDELARAQTVLNEFAQDEYNWLLNKQYAAEERRGRKKKNNDK